MESRTQGSRPRTQKKSEAKAKAKDSLSEDRHSGGFRGGDGGDASPPTSLKVTILAEKSASVSNKSAPFRDASPPTDLNVTNPAKNQSQFW